MAALPDDYPSDPEPAAPAATLPAVPIAPAPPSIAEDLPLSLDIVPATEPAEEPVPDAILPAAARLAQLGAGGAALLARLLADERALNLPPSAPPAEFEGPDGELLHLQDVIIYLALETLRKPR